MADPKASWRRVRFSDMVTSAGATRKARGWTAGDGGIERYVGLEHLDANSPTIRRWGTPETVGENSDLRHFEPGDVILARRGIEQRKVGIAEFRGVASGHALVFRARPEVVLPGFLPYFLLSDVFMNRALEFSAGSLSKTVNLSALMRQEFALPPLEEQRRATGMLSALRRAVDLASAAMATAETLFSATLEHLFTRGLNSDGEPVRVKYLTHPPTWRVESLEALARVERGMFSHRPRNLPEFFGGPYPFVQTGDVAASRGNLTGASQMLSDHGKTYSKSFPANSILVTIAAVIGATAITTEETWCPDSIVGIVPRNSNISVRFLELALRRLRPFLEFHEATQTAQKNINLQNLRPLLIAYPTRDVQEQIVENLLAIESRIEGCRQRLVLALRLAALTTDEHLRGEA